jgi:hypothetical protein
LGRGEGSREQKETGGEQGFEMAHWMAGEWLTSG